MKRKLFVFLMIDLFVITFLITAIIAQSKREVAARVNGKIITTEDLDYQVKMTEIQINSFLEKDQTADQNLKTKILDYMIDQELIAQEAERKSLSVSDEEVQIQLQKMDSESLFKLFEENGIPRSFVLKNLKQDMLFDKFRVDYANLNTVSSADIIHYYEENKQSFFVEEIEASHIFLPFIDDVEGKGLSAVAKEEDQYNLSKKIIKELENGESFAALAKKYSKDRNTSDNGGYIGVIQRGYMQDLWEDGAFALEKGEFSVEPIRTNFGYHIIMVHDKESYYRDIRGLKIEIETLLKEKQFDLFLANLRSSSKIEKPE